jgi:hypothetical protein
MSKLLFKIAEFVESNPLFSLERKIHAADYLSFHVDNDNSRYYYGYRRSEYLAQKYKNRAQVTKDPKKAIQYLVRSFSYLASAAHLRAKYLFEEKAYYRMEEAEARVQEAQYFAQLANDPVEIAERRTNIYRYRAKLVKWQRRVHKYEYGSIQAAEYDNQEAEEHAQEAKYWTEVVKYYIAQNPPHTWHPKPRYSDGQICRIAEGAVIAYRGAYEAGLRIIRANKRLVKRANDARHFATTSSTTSSDDPILISWWHARMYEYQALAAQYSSHVAEYSEQEARFYALSANYKACLQEYCKTTDRMKELKEELGEFHPPSYGSSFWDIHADPYVTENEYTLFLLKDTPAQVLAFAERECTRADQAHADYVWNCSQAANYRAEAEKMYRKRLILILQGELDRIKETKLLIYSDRCFTVMEKVLGYLKFVDEQTKQTNVQTK